MNTRLQLDFTSITLPQLLYYISNPPNLSKLQWWELAKHKALQTASNQMLHTSVFIHFWRLDQTRLRSNDSLLSSWFCYAAITSKIGSSRLATSLLVSPHFSRVPMFIQKAITKNGHVSSTKNLRLDKLHVRQCAHYDYGRPTAQAPTSHLRGVRAALMIECSSLEKPPNLFLLKLLWL